MSIVVLRQGIDTLEASIGGRLDEHSASVLERWKARAQELETPQHAPLGGLDFAVQPQGAKPYAYKLAGDEASIKLGRSKKAPAASIRLSALGLALYDPAVLYERICTLAVGFLDCEGERKLSRIDVCADFQGFDLADLGGARFVCRADYRPIYPNAEHPETYMFGKSPLVVRVYNKTRELAVSGKTWMHALWQQHPDYDPSIEVWRFEVQISRETLRELDFDTPRLGIARAADLLKFGLGWASLRVPKGRSSDRWPLHPAWEELARATGSHTTLTREGLKAGLAPLSRIVPSVGGYAISAAAGLGLDAFDDTWRILGVKVREYIGPDKDFARAVRNRQIERLGKGDVA